VLPNGEADGDLVAEITVLADPTFGKVYRSRGATTGNVRSTEQQYLQLLRPGLVVCSIA
jgi:hypothetical protein